MLKGKKRRNVGVCSQTIIQFVMCIVLKDISFAYHLKNNILLCVHVNIELNLQPITKRPILVLSNKLLIHYV